MKKAPLLLIAGVGGVILIGTGALILITGSAYPFAGYLDIVAGVGLILGMVHGHLTKKGGP